MSSTTATPRNIALLQELGGIVCRCNKPKDAGHSFCRACYYALTKDLRRRLHLRFGKGYEDAYSEAVMHLRLRPLQLDLANLVHEPGGSCSCGRGALDFDPACPVHRRRRP